MDIFEIGEKVIVKKGESNNIDWLDIHEKTVGRKLTILEVDYSDETVLLQLDNVQLDNNEIWYSFEWVEKVDTKVMKGK